MLIGTRPCENAHPAALPVEVAASNTERPPARQMSISPVIVLDRRSERRRRDVGSGES